MIELVIVVAIVGILYGIVYPNYTNFIIRARRTDAQTSLLDLANRMEQFYRDHLNYQDATIGEGKSTDVLADPNSAQGWYTLSIRDATKETYTLKATPKSIQATGDTLCQSLLFDHLGIKNITEGSNGRPTGSAEQCW